MGNIVTAVLFTIFAYLQLNDPDPVLWVMAYLLFSLIAVLRYFKKLNLMMIYAGYVIYGISLLIFLPELWDWIQIGTPSITGKMKADSPYVEYTREFFGLLICLIACGSYHYLLMKEQKNTK